MSISPNHLSDILAERKNGGQKLKERIAERLEMSFEDMRFEDMLAMGRQIVEGRSENIVTSENRTGSDEEYVEKLINNAGYLNMASGIIESKKVCYTRS